MLQVCCIICSDTQPIQNLRVLQRVAAVTDGDAKAKEDAKMEWARSWIAAGLAAVESIIASTAGKCCFGDVVTLADICLVPQVRFARPHQAPRCSSISLNLLAQGVQRCALRRGLDPAADRRQGQRAPCRAARVHRGAPTAAG